ncbi:hypothetical protein [Brevifollis gellanilyticus]|uniref:DUF4760 domain-containing protein n=1 Tax=Brevifollis gellanilyticus TaxID=748831 RepID=A0A512MCG2_9BACT|nr:hypothetical protein [Brevifollis gellanilyticus]GEP44430.1 hypothetical protein BGE01nite_37210 [Brevifollis gellanilyticus]
MLSVISWIGNHFFDLLSAVGIVSGLVFTAVSYREDTKSRRLSNLVTLTKQHREIWEETQTNQKLDRVRDPLADLYTKPVTSEESQFVMLLMFHLHCWYRAIQEGEVKVLEGLEMDIRSFLGKPIPKFVWEQRKAYFDPDFRTFVDRVISS